MGGAILDRPAVELARLVAARELSSRELVEAHLERVAERPELNAIVGARDPDELRAQARAADEDLVRHGPRGPLHGFPHAVKDLAEAAGLPWTLGSPLYADRVGVVDAPGVRRIREAGAILVGKTNVPEFGYGSHTVNPVWGPTRNPLDPTRSAGGSSGGAAAALAAGLVPLADGSDYLGSLRNPAGFCAVYGMRPSPGRVPKPGFVAQLGESGPMARGVDDLALLLSVMSGPDPTAPLARTDRVPGTVRRRDDLRGLRVGWLGDLDGALPTEPGLLPVCRRAVDVLAGLGADVDDTTLGFDPERLWRALLVWRWWAALEHAPLHADPATRERLRAEVRWEVEQGLALSALDVTRALAERDAWHAAVLDLFARFDVLVAPSAQVFPFPVETPWPAEIDGRPMDSYHRWMQTVAPWSLAPTPVVAVPAGRDPRGLPAGVQLVGAPGADVALLEVAGLYERAVSDA